MKRITLIMLALLIAIVSSTAQNVVNLKNGSIIRGELIEYIPGEKTTIQTQDGNIFVFNDEDVASVIRDESTENATNKIAGYNEKYLAPRGYRGFIDITPFDLTIQSLAFSLNTTHGYQFNHNVFVGGGVGFSANYANGFFSIPIYASFKGNVARGAVQFTYGLNVGFGIGRGESSDYYYINDSYRYEDYIITGTSFYNNYSIGMRLPVNPNFAVKIISEMDLYMGAYVNFGWGIGLGFEF